MFKEELMNKLVGYLEQIMFEKKKKKKNVLTKGVYGLPSRYC